MMNQTNQIKVYETEMDALQKSLTNVGERLSRIASNVSSISLPPTCGGRVRFSMGLSLSHGSVGRGSTIEESLRVIARGLTMTEEHTMSLAGAVNQVTMRFLNVEHTLAGTSLGTGNGTHFTIGGKPTGIIGISPQLQEILNRISQEAKERESIRIANQAKLYDDDGLYGGAQGDARNDTDHYPQFYDMIEKNTGKRPANDKELKAYLEAMNQEGCGYMAMTNLIIKQYEGRSEEFKKTFGFDLYDEKTGDINYNLLMVDLYSATDDHVKGLFGDRIVSSSGVTATTMKYRIEKYLTDHGVQATMNLNAPVTVDNFSTMTKNGGDIVVSIGYPMIMRTADGTPYTVENAGHAMVVTGVETIMIDGKATKVFKVSSWGKVWYVNPNDEHGHCDLRQITYNN